MANEVPEFIIKLIVRAQNQAAGVMGQVQGQVDKVTGAMDKNTTAQKKATKATKDQGEAVQDLEGRFQSFNTELEKNSIAAGDAADTLKRFAAEYRALAKQQVPGSDDQREFDRRARAAEDSGKTYTKVHRQQIAESEARIEQDAKEAQARKEAAMDAGEAQREVLEMIQGLERDSQLQRVAGRERMSKDAQRERAERMQSYEDFETMTAAEKRRYLEQESQSRADERRARREAAERAAATDALWDEIGLTRVLAQARKEIPAQRQASIGPDRAPELSEFRERPRRSGADVSRVDLDLQRAEAAESVRIETERVNGVMAEREREAKRVKDAADARARIQKQAIKDEGDLRAATVKSTQAENERRRSLMETLQAYDRFKADVDVGLHDKASAKTGFKAFGRDIRKASSGFAAGTDESFVGGVASDETSRKIADIDAGVLRLGRNANRSRSFLSRLLDINPRGSDAYIGAMERLDAAFTKNRSSSVQFVAALRSMLIIGVLAFLDQLVGAAVAVGGALVSLAAAALQAGAAIGGMAVAAGAQALPVLGLLAAAWGRVGAVFDALKKQQQAQQTASDDATAAAERQANAADAVKSAQEQLASAHRGVTDASRGVADATRGVADANRALTKAQEELTAARAGAKDELEDLTAAERAAELQRRSADLAQKDSAAALRRAIATGDVSNQDAARLRADEATNNVGVAARASRRATAERVRVGGDPEKLDSVTQAREGVRGAERGVDDAQRGLEAAKRQVSDANRAVAQAERGLAKAQRAAADAGKEVGSAAKALNQLLAQLSPAERRLYNALLRLKSNFARVFTGPGGVTESITNAFTYGVNKANDLLSDPKLIGAARRLSAGISTELKSIFDGLSSSGTRSFFADMADEATKNLPKITRILKEVGGLLGNIARAAAPAFSKFLDFLGQSAEKANDATGSKSGFAKLEDFFMKGEQYAESILRLAGALAELFLALMGAGASDTGGTMIDQMVVKLNDASDWVRAHEAEVRKFFEDSAKAAGDVAWAVGELAKGLFSLFKADQVKAFSEMIGNVLVPILVNLFTFIGIITTAFNKAFGDGAAADIAVFAGSFFLLNKLFGSMLTGIARMVLGFAKLTGALRLVGLAQLLVTAAAGPWLALAIAIGIAVVMLDRKFHFLKPTLDAVGKGFAWVVDKAKDVWSQIKSGRGVIGAFTFPLRNLFRVFKMVFENIKDTVTTFARIIKRLFKGDIYGAIGELGGLMGRMGKRVVRLLWDMGKDVGKSAWNIGKYILLGLWEGIKFVFVKLPVWLAKAFYNSLIKPILEFLGIASPSKRFAEMGRNLIRGLRDGIREMLGGIGGFLINVGKAIVQGVVDGIKAAPGALLGALKGLLGIGGKLAEGAKNLGGKVIGGIKGFFGKGDDDKKDEKKPATKETANATAVAALKELANASLDPKTLDANLKNWQNFWKDMSRSAQKGTEEIQRQFRDMRVATSKSVDRMYRDIRGSLGDINKSFDTRGEKMAESWGSAIGAVQKVTGDGYNYIGHETNKILKSLGAKHINFGLTGPTPAKAKKGKGKAVGGWIGNQGERGADAVHTVLGRGEAVLNWGQQKLVEPALAFAKRYGGAAYGSLNEVFSSSSSQHAAEVPGGMAGGGFSGDLKGAGKGFGPMMKYLNSKFGPIYVMSGNRPGSKVAGSGRLSNHSGGNAVDITAPGIEGASQSNPPENLNKGAAARMDKLNAFIMKYIHPKIGLDHVWRAPTGGNHWNHIHQGIQPEYNKSIAKMKAFLAKLPEGGEFGGSTDLKKLVVGGERKGAMRSVVESVLDKVTKLAQKRIDKEADAAGTGTDQGTGHAYDGSVDTVNKKYPRHIGPKAGAVRFSENLVAKIAQSVGLPGKVFGQIAHGESDFYPGIQQPDPGDGMVGYGLWQMTPNAWGGGAAKQHFNKLGGIPAMFNPIKNAEMAKFLFKAAGNSIRPWYGTKYVTSNANRGGFAGEFANGGVVPGALGQAVPILAHAKEWILNEGQQNRIANWIGTSKDKVAGALGFGHNTKTSAKTGTEVNSPGKDDKEKKDKKEEKETSQVTKAVVKAADKLQKKLEEFELPTIYSISAENLERLSQEGLKALRKMKIRSSKFLDDFKGTFDKVFGDEGLLAQLSESVELRIAQMARDIASATFKINRKTGQITKLLSETDVADREYTNLGKSYKLLMGKKGVIASGLRNVSKRIDVLRKGGIKDDERDTYEYLVGYQRALKKSLAEVTDSINENVAARYEAVTNAINARTAAAEETAGRKNAVIDLLDRANALTGGTMGGLNGSRMAGRRTAVIDEQILGLEKAQRFAKRRGRTKEVEEIQATIDGLRMDAAEAVAAGIQADADEITRQSGRNTAKADLVSRIGTALGRMDMVAAANAMKLDENARLISKLEKKQWDAARKGYHALAETIGDQIADLRANAVDIAASILAGAVEAVNNAAGRRSAALDLRGRGADLLEKANNYEGAFAQRGDILRERGNSMASQRNELYGLYMRAISEGNQGVMESTFDQIKELEMAMSENTAAIESNTVAARQARIEAITGRGSFQGGVFNGLVGIVDALGGLAGITDIPAKLELVRKAGVTLGETLNGGNGLPGLAANLTDLTGGRVNVGGMSPADIVKYLATVPYDQIEATFNKEQRDQFRELINAVIDNAAAQVANTDQIRQLTGLTTQTWTSTPMQWFRQAVYDGNGGLLPQYQNPSLGIVNPSTPYSSSTMAAAASGQMGSRGTTQVTNNVTNEERTVDMDADTLANKLYFKQKTGGR